MIHSFDEENSFSQSQEVTAFLDRFYLSAFPTMSHHETVYDLERQMAGIDRVIYLVGGDVIQIDEKIRRKNYNDFALEYLANDSTGKLGWINKDLDIDYIVYIWLESRSGYLLNWQDLSRAWSLSGVDWINKYKLYPARNRTYNTWFVPVPLHEVLRLVHAKFIEVE